MSSRPPPRRDDGLCVLVVDDDAVDRAAVRRALSRQDPQIEIEEAVDVASAVAAQSARSFDCGVVDYHLPDGTALELIQKLDASSRGRLPVVILTGFKDDALALAALQLGAQDYLAKDEMDGRVLVRAIRYAIERARVGELQQRLVHADRLISIGQLAAGVAHEVNNPASHVMCSLELLEDHVREIEAGVSEIVSLVAARGGAQLQAAVAESARERRLEPALAECAALIQGGLRGMERIRSITKGLYSFARIERDEVEDLDLVEVIESACRIVYNELRHRAQLVTELERLPRIAADRGKLAQVVTNLLMNSVQAIEPGASDANRIRVACRVEGDAIRLSVEDTGAGIPPEVIDRVFQPFFTTKPRDRGTGLGLSLCLDIVRKHGGDIELHSEVGVGTRVDVTLPVATGLRVTVPAPAARPAVTQTDGAAEAGRRARVLVVDDEVVLGRLYQRMLDPYHDVLVASGGREGLEILERDQRFDIVLCDLMMPDVDGMAVYEYLQRERPSLIERMVFCTGGVFTERVQAFLSRVGNPCLTKPMTRRELLDTVRRVADGR